MRYLLVVPVAAFPLSRNRFAVESAFAEHLRRLFDRLSPPFTEMVVTAVGMPADEYERSRSHLGLLDADAHHIRLEVLFEADESRRRFAQRFPWLLRRLDRLVASSGLVHAGPSADPTRPFEIASLVLAVRRGVPTISVTDIDSRDNAWMLREAGMWSRKSYLVSRALWDPLRHLQHRFVARDCDLVLFKGARLVEDYGRRCPRVREIQDPGFDVEHVIDDRALARKLRAVRDPSRPIELAFFGRFVPYKGVDRILDAYSLARRRREDLRLHLLGDGPERARLWERAARVPDIEWHPPLPYGEEFFTTIRAWHVLLAAPLRADTPRSTWDAIAGGLMVLAFDTEFYRAMREATGVVSTVPWPSVGALADAMVELAADRERLALRIERTARVARTNTQSHWLDRRVRWTRAVLPPEVFAPAQGRRSSG